MGGGPSSPASARGSSPANKYKASRPDPLTITRRATIGGVDSPLSLGTPSPTTPDSGGYAIDGRKLSMSEYNRERRRAEVERLAEKKAARRQLESPQPVASFKELKKLSNKDKLLEEIRIRSPTCTQRTTYSVMVQWEMQHRVGEMKVDKFELQWALHESATSSDDVHGVASLDSSPDVKLSVRCTAEWTAFPRAVVNEEKRTVYIGGLDPGCQPLCFRVRARNLSGWGNWCDLSPPIRTLGTAIPAPKAAEVTAYTCELRWEPKKGWEHYGQVIYYRLYGRRIPSEDGSDRALPLGFFASLEPTVLYDGRDTTYIVGKRGSKPLAPRCQYGFHLECRTGLSRGDKRYCSDFKSTERVVKTPVTVPAQPAVPTVTWAASTSLSLSWVPPPSDGGSMIMRYAVEGRARDAPEGKFKTYYRGPDCSCVVGAEVGKTEELLGMIDQGPLAEGTEYGFKVTAISEEGASSPSKLVWVRTPTILEEEAEAAERAELDELRRRSSMRSQQSANEGEQMNGGEEGGDWEGGELLASPNGIVDLPVGWEEYYDPASGECFYYNSVTGENQWEAPAGAGAGARAGSSNGEEGKEGKADDALLFRKKRFRFLHAMQHLCRESVDCENGALSIRVRRDSLVADSFAAMRRLDANKLRRRLRVVFEGEAGIDSGGLSKDWFLELSRQLLLPEYCLFFRGSNGSYMIDPRSGVQNEAPQYFRMFGRLLGKALLDQHMVELPLCRGLYKRILDLAEVDSVLSSSLAWMLKNDITDVIDETFSVMVEEFGAMRELELVPNGKRTAVTEQNKRRYVDAVVTWRFGGAVSNQLKCMLEGLYEVVPPEHLSEFSAEELELLLNGVPSIDVAALRNGYVRYTGGFSATSYSVRLFWEAMEDFSDDECAQVLRFCTGSSKMPLDGYPETLPFQLTQSEYGADALPTAHTCFNQLVLPPYRTKERLVEKLMYACGSAVGFALT